MAAGEEGAASSRVGASASVTRTVTVSPSIRRAQIQVASATWTSVDRIEAQPESGAGDCSYWPARGSGRPPRPVHRPSGCTQRVTSGRLASACSWRRPLVSWPATGQAAVDDLRAVGVRPPGATTDSRFYGGPLSLGFARQGHYNEAGRLEGGTVSCYGWRSFVLRARMAWRS